MVSQSSILVGTFFWGLVFAGLIAFRLDRPVPVLGERTLSEEAFRTEIEPETGGHFKRDDVLEAIRSLFETIKRKVFHA